jgi:hypothetical protein
MDAAIAHGFLATLFEDAPHGRRAAALMVERARVPPYGGEHGERFPGPVFLFPFAYDLAYAFLEAGEREKVAAHFRSFYNHFSVEWGPKGIFAVSRGVFPVPGVMGLAVLRDKGAFHLARPEEPPPVVTLAPEADPGPRQGVPVNVFEAGRLPRRWLMNGPFEGDGDPLSPLGGPAAARPRQGTGVAYRGATFRFVPLPDDAFHSLGGMREPMEYIDVPAAEATSRSYLYCLLEVKAEAGCLLSRAHPLGPRWARLWINGRTLADGTVARLQPGLHRVLVEVRGALAVPAFPPADAGAAEAEARKRRWLLEQWQAARRGHGETGELPEVPLILAMCRRGVRTHWLHAIEEARRTGELRMGGWALPFVVACATATGEGLLPDTPSLLEALPGLASSPSLGDRDLCFAMGVTAGPLRAALAREFRRRFLADRLDRLSCLSLVAALAYYPLGEAGRD